MGRKLAMFTTVDGDTYPAGTEVPDDVAKQITNPKAWGETASVNQTDPGADPEANDWGSKSAKDLQAEVDRRNDEREDDAAIVLNGTGKDGKVVKADLVAALEADDAAQPQD